MSTTATTPSPRTQRMPTPVARWLAGWALAAVGAGTLVLVFLDPATGGIDDAGGPVALVLLVGLGVAAQLAAVEVNRTRSSHIVSLIEVAVVTSFLLTNGLWGWFVAVISVALAQVPQDKPWFKRAFNIAQAAVAGAAAAFVYELLAPATSDVGWQHVLAVTLATLLFGLVNWLAVMGVLTRVEGRSVWSLSPQTRTLSSFSTLGNISIGVVTAVMWRARPDMAFLAAVPVISVWLAYRGIAATRASLEREHAYAQRLARVLDAVEEGVVVIDAHHCVELWSPAMERLTGIGRDGAIRAPLKELVKPLDVRGEPVDVVHLADTRTLGMPTEWRLADVDGQMRDLVVSVAPIRSEGERIGTVLLVHDMTRQREVERLKDDFLMRVSHELRTPLTPIQGFAQSLRSHGDMMTPEQVDDALGRIVARAGDLARIVDDLLLVATPGSTHANIPQPVSVDHLVAAAIEGTLRSHPERAGDVSVSNGPRVGPTARTAVLDVAAVTRILEVLLDNALRYSSPGTTVDVLVTAAAHQLEMAVTDRGRGIPTHQVDQVFERFHRVEDPLVMTTRGVGVGLHIARRLARLQGGDITVTSKLGDGSTFTVQVPVTAPAGLERELDAATPARPPASA